MKRCRIVDTQNGTYFHDGDIFTRKDDIIEALASYHDIDFTGVKSDDEPFEDIFEFLDTIPYKDDRLNWLLEYGEWDLEEVKNE